MSESMQDTAFLDLELTVEVWLGTELVPLASLLELRPGEVLPLSHDPDGPVDLVVNGAVVASGELVVVDGKFGFRVTRTASHRLAEVEQQAAEQAAMTAGEAATDLPEPAEEPAAKEPKRKARAKPAAKKEK